MSRSDALLSDVVDDHATHLHSRSIPASSADVPLTPLLSIRASVPHQLSTDVGNVLEDRRPVRPDLLTSGEGAVRVCRLLASISGSKQSTNASMSWAFIASRSRSETGATPIAHPPSAPRPRSSVLGATSRQCSCIRRAWTPTRASFRLSPSQSTWVDHVVPLSGETRLTSRVDKPSRPFTCASLVRTRHVHPPPPPWSRRRGRARRRRRRRAASSSHWRGSRRRPLDSRSVPLRGCATS